MLMNGEKCESKVTLMKGFGEMASWTSPGGRKGSACTLIEWRGGGCSFSCIISYCMMWMLSL